MQTVVCQSLGLIMVDDHVALKFANLAHELKLRNNYAEITQITQISQKVRRNYAEITQKLHAKITQKLRRNYANISKLPFA